MLPLRGRSFKVQVQQIPTRAGSLLTDKAETTPRSSGRISLLLPATLILKISTDPSSFKLGEVTVLIYFDSKNPTARKVISIPPGPNLGVRLSGKRIIVQIALNRELPSVTGWPGRLLDEAASGCGTSSSPSSGTESSLSALAGCCWPGRLVTGPRALA